MFLAASTAFVSFSSGPSVAAAAKQASAKAPTRRALLVGINNYKTLSPGSRGAFDSLNGPLKDVEELAKLLESRYGFKRENIHILPEKEATHDGILAAIQRYLIDQAAPGDECLFFFAGHGSFIINSKSAQSNRQDETLVPIDYVRSITKKEEFKDLRDKELAQYFNRALDKGIVLTVIADSCHSGSIARGDTTIKARSLGGEKFDLAEPPSASENKRPGDRGALIFSAALAEQIAWESEYNGVARGDFSHALIEVLSSPSAEMLTAEQVFQQVAARMKSRGLAQEPNLDANSDRRRRTLFGSPTSYSTGRPIFVVRGVDVAKGEVTLDKGRAFGITEGSELIQKTSIAAGARPVRLRITNATEMTSSVAKPVTPAEIRKVKVGDTFEQDKWAASKDSIQIWLPPANLSAAEVKRIAQEMAKLRASDRIQIVDDPTQQVATHRLYFDGTNWKLDLPSGASENLGRAPTAQAVIEKSSATSNGKARLFVSLPLFSELRSRIKLGPGTAKSAVNIAASESGATYKLIGRATDGGASIEYAWVLPGAIKAETEAEALARGSSNGTSTEPKPSPLPPITDWVKVGDDAEALAKAAGELEDLALRLNKISGWVTLQAPLGSGTLDPLFPFRLTVLKRDGTPAGDKLLENETYQLALVADQTAAQSGRMEKRWVYVFSIDKNGNSSLLYPADVGVGNQYPKEADGQLQLAIPPLAEFKVVGPSDGGVLGPETYILLATTERLADPVALEFEGVRTPEEIRNNRVATKGERGENSPLEELLTGIGSVARSAKVTRTSANWSIQQLFFVSVPK
jgi:hypothetical protein